MKKMIYIIGLSAVIIAFSVVLWYNNSYHDTPNEQLKTVFAKTKNKEKTVIVFHKTGCEDCDKIRVAVGRMQDKRDRALKNTIVVDYKNPKTRQYFEQYHIKAVPTVVVVQNGGVVKQMIEPSGKQLSQLVSE